MLSSAIENCPLSNHHAARLYGLEGEAMFRALEKLQEGSHPKLSESDVASYAAHQIVSYIYPQWQSAHTDALLSGYVNRTLDESTRKELDDLVLPVVRDILTREVSSGIANWVQYTPAPSTIGANRSILEQYQGHYQYTEPEYTQVQINGKTVDENWQERGHFGTIRPFFKPLKSYVTGLAPAKVGTEEYQKDLDEVTTKGRTGTDGKSAYEYDTPLFWLFDMPHLPTTFLRVARAELPADLSILETARFLAAFGLGTFEAANTAYGMKWGKVSNTTPLWRPVTAIRSGDTFGNEVIADWSPQLPTPEHPEYPSGHCTHTSAATHAIRLYLGSDDIDVVLPTDYAKVNDPNYPIANRHFTSLTDIMDDVTDARVFGGVHYRHSCNDAATLARRAMEASFQHFGVKGAPAPGPSCHTDTDCKKGACYCATPSQTSRKLLFGSSSSDSSKHKSCSCS